MYFQNYFANRFKKLEGFTIYIYNIYTCSHRIRYTTLAFGFSLYRYFYLLCMLNVYNFEWPGGRIRLGQKKLIKTMTVT